MGRRIISDKSKRIWELDFIRGIAVLFMIVHHLYYTLSLYFNINIFSGIPAIKDVFLAIVENGGAVFILISGICCCYSKSNLKRGLNLFFIAMLVTYATLIFQEYIEKGSSALITFGVLHCLAVLMIIGHFLLKMPKIKFVTNFIYLFLSVGLIILGYVLRHYNYNFPVLYGYPIYKIMPSADYFPLLPFLGWFILGIFIGKTFYLKGNRVFGKKHNGNFFLIRGISFIGKHSLIVYLAHQPLIYFACTLLV